MSGALQAVYQNLRSFGFPNGWPALIGDAFGGGFFAGQINISGTKYNLIVADKSVGGAYGKTWGPTSTTGFTSEIDGPTNSAGISALGSTYEAARFCENLNTGGFTDWYLPATNELNTLYYYLKPNTNINNDASGANANAVSPQPVSTNFTLSDPAQTSATSFRTGASSQEFELEEHFSSTEFNDTRARSIGFVTGDRNAAFKNTTSYYTRAIRRVLA